MNAVDQDGDTALMGAAEQGHVDVVTRLLAKGANVNVKNRDGGFTSLMKVAGAEKPGLSACFGCFCNTERMSMPKTRTAQRH